jgi:hypothetical protein
MNRYARIMHGMGWLALAAWLAVWAQGRSVEADGLELELHTLLALGAAAATLLSLGWTLAFLLLAPERFADAAARRTRNLALALASLALSVVAVQFALSGSMLWRRITPEQHALLGGLLLATHLAALWSERRALRERDRP